MAYIAVNNADDFVRLDINANGVDYAGNVDAAMANASTYSIPALQEVTVNATPGTFNWQQLDSLSEFVVTTPSTNSVAVTLVLDPDYFHGNASIDPGIFEIVNSKTKTYFRLYWSGDSTGDKYIQGEGYLSALAPTVSPGSPVWTTPLEILVIGDFETGTVPA